MSIKEIRYELQRLLNRYKAVRTFEALVLACSTGLVVFASLQLLMPSAWAVIAAIVTGVMVLTYRVIQLRIFQIGEESMVRYLNRQLPQLQESGDLLLREANELTVLEQLQQLRTAKQFADIRVTFRLPNQLMQAILILIGCGLIAGVLIVGFDGPYRTATVVTPGRGSAVAGKQLLPAAVRQLDVHVSPPAYTRLADQRLHAFPIVAPENSVASWRIEFSAPVQGASLIFDGKDTVALHASGSSYTAQRTLPASGFYQLMWLTSRGERKHSDFHAIQIRKDSPPVLKIDNLEQFTQVEAAPKISVDLKATLADDYGLADAYIVATVSKGSGEGIKFREERLRFDAPPRINGKKVSATRRIDLIKLGLDPGDELYYYIEAFDNMTPAPNRARTETYFIAVKDTSEVTTSVDPGLGVDLMPEYFRSQRQIIIDSEKLLKEKKQISREKFNARSNELAHDEKVLRLRYGEFLGEEFETSIGPSNGGVANGEDDIVKQYGHQHDTDEEHAAHAEAPAKASAERGHTHNGADKDEDPAKAYMHAHDGEEEATFFTQSIRAKLKAAVTIMWDAELHLRLYTPEKSLPYQYRALKLLKEISQDSRIYVHRTGFDPPPLKEDKRLTGELLEANSSSANTQSVVSDKYPAIRSALNWMEVNSPQDGITSASRDLLLRAGTELSAAALQQPGRYLNALSLLRAYTENELPKAERESALSTIREAFYQVLPANADHPASRTRTTHPLDDDFLKNYDALPNESSR